MHQIDMLALRISFDFVNTCEYQGILQGQVPREVEASFQQCFLSDVGIKDLSLLAASLDELVHQEVLQRAKNVFKAKKLPMFGHIELKQMQEVLEQVSQILLSLNDCQKFIGILDFIL